MSATTSSAQTAPASNSSQAARESSESSAKNKPRSPADLFSSLLDLISATRDQPMLLGGDLREVAEADELDNPLFGNTETDPNALLNPAANPLADLIGWPGAAAAMASTAEATASALGASNAEKGLALQGMKPLAEPVDADPDLMVNPKTAESNGAKAQGNALANTAVPPSAGSAPSSDSVSVRYSDTPDPTESPEAGSGNASRNGSSMAARPANWRSTTALATSPSTHSAALQASSATTQTSAIQQTQNAALQRNPMADAALPGLRNTATAGERFSTPSAGEAASASADWVAVGAPGHASQGDTGASGGERETSTSMGASAPEMADAETPEEAFSLDAALAGEEELDGNAFLSPNQLRHANVRIGEGTDEAIDIRLSLEGDAVNVDFRTDNADVRAGLQHNAGASLSELMQRGGIQLGGVSVGAQSQQHRGQSGQSGQSETAPSQVGASARRGGSAGRPGLLANAESTSRAPTARRSDGGPALDIFA